MEYAFAMFVNPTSGGNRAGIYMQLQAQSIKFNLKQVCYVDIYNMFDKNSRDQGMKELLSKQVQKLQTRVIVCGGDGTVMWVVEEMVRHGIDLVNCPIGIVPFGTGNDFSRVLGWGGDTSGDLGSCLSNLKQNIQEWVDAIIEDFDIWEVQVVAHENGYFRRIKKQDGGYIKEELYEQDKHKKVIKKNMSNYFSLGVDARIGYGFDKRRTQSACCNKVVYCCEGLKKMFMSNPTTNAVLQNMEIIADEHVDALHIDPTNVKDILFSTAQEHKYTLKGNPVTLLCINIPSYSGGAGNVWQACQGKVGLIQKGQPVVDQFHPQVFGDGEIEFVTFNTIIGMANERVISGQAQRVAQGKGPFNFRFKQSQGVNPVIQYFQVDGEFYQAINPSHLSMCHSREVPNGKIKVLVKRSFRNLS